MVVTKEEFIVKFQAWIERKLKDSLPEEDFEGSMMKQSLEIIYKHKQEMSNLSWP